MEADAQGQRIRKATYTAALCVAVPHILIGLIAGYIIASGAQKYWPFLALFSVSGIFASVSAFLSFRLVWRRAVLVRETRRRGCIYGALSAIIALVLSSLFLTVIVAMAENLAATPTGTAAKVSPVWLIAGPLFTVILALIQWGLPASLAGGLLGWYFSRNPEGPKTSEPFS